MSKKFGLIGRTLSYSFSKIIHEFLFETFEIDAHYELIEVESVNRELLESYDGLNVTIPYKQDIIPFLDENHCPFPACNTIKNVEGKLIGYNTDVAGFELLVEELALPQIDKIVILGDGATSKMIQYLYSDKELIVLTRKSKENHLSKIAEVQADLLINATPVGMNAFESLVPELAIQNFKGIIDLNYNPMNSKLALDSKKYQVPFIGGLDMLIEQAIKAFEIWNEIDVDVAIRKRLQQYVCFQIFSKIALIGMPLVGKTTMVNRFQGYDLDAEISKNYQKTPKELLEAGIFREAETQILSDLIKQEASLIALGGGAALKQENIALLKDYLIVLVDEPLEVLEKRWEPGARPLLKEKTDLKKTYEERMPRYQQVSNIVLTGSELEAVLNEHFTD